MTACRHLVDDRSRMRPFEIPSVTKFATLKISDLIRSQASSPALSRTTQTCSTHDSESSQANDVSRLIPATVSAHKRELSNNSLVHQISRKFSTIFGNGNPTVVHKPNLRTRPSLRSIQDKFLLPASNGEQELSVGDSTNPSSFNDSGSISPADHSTGKTSLDSNVASQFSSKSQHDRCFGLRKSLMIGSRIYERPLTPIKEVPAPISPTVITVESTANAKIFFETHFDTLFSSQISSRSQRRHDLESYLQKFALSSQQRQEELATWASKETEHLRRSRVLKSKINEMSGSAGIAIAGYEVVRILGKGSFGVVRLVRARDTEGKSVHSISSSSGFLQNGSQSPGEEVSNLTTAAVQAEKSDDGQRMPQFHDLRKAKKQVFAMKVIRKSDMLRNSQEGHLRAERDFLVASEKSQWVVPLIASFQDTTNLYLVMEYMVGGDFLGLLFRMDTLKPKNARWYIAEMILCVEEAHRLRWIHRDVKPDNFLISASGHLKISDFGLAFDGHWAHDQNYFNDHRHSLMESLGIFVDGDSIDRKEGRKIAAGMDRVNRLSGAKVCDKKPQFDGPADKEGILEWRNRVGTRKLARSVVGTSQYMAPEVIRGHFYDGRCDWWSIGIILFEVTDPAAPSTAFH